MSVENEDIYYFVGDYIYNVLQPTVIGNVDMFKYVLGRVILNKI